MLAAREPVQLDELIGDEENRPRADLVADVESELPEEATAGFSREQQARALCEELSAMIGNRCPA